MDAVEFVKKFGISYVKLITVDTNLKEIEIHISCGDKNIVDKVCVEDLIGLVESHDVVDRLGGLVLAKMKLRDVYHYRLHQSISDVEACQ